LKILKTMQMCLINMNYSLLSKLSVVVLFHLISIQSFSQYVNNELDSIISIILDSSKKYDNTISLSDAQHENAVLERIIQSPNYSNADVLILTSYIHRSKYFSPDDLTNFINLFIVKPINTDYVDIDYVKVKWFEISGHRDNNELNKASDLQTSLESYIAAIKNPNHNLERAHIYASEYNIVMNIIRREIEQGIALCNENEKTARRIGDTCLIIQSIYNRCEFYIFQGLLPKFIEESEYCLYLDSIRSDKSEFYVLNLIHLVDAYIYSGNKPKRSLELLELIHEEKDFTIDSYAYYAKFLGSLEPNDEMALEVFQRVECQNMLDFFHKTDSLCEKHLYPVDYYQFLRESAHALVNFGYSKEAILAMEKANRVNKKIYSTDLTNALVKQKISTLEDEKNLELKYTQKISNIYLVILLVGSIILFGISLMLIRKTKQNKILAQKNATIIRQDDEKALLMSELHHRVKNNFQIISSLLSLEIKNIEDKAMQEILKENQSRINSMALTHEKLYGNNDFEYELDVFLKSLYSDLIAIFNAPNSCLQLEINTDSKIDLDMATPLGLIFNELITNSLKHGVITDKQTTIFITIQTNINTIQIVYTDSGNGMNEEIDFKSAKSMGLNIVKRLTRQLQGSVTYEDKCFHLSFPKV